MKLSILTKSSMGDGLILCGDFGIAYFQNRQKYYKFQFMCKHEHTYIYDDNTHFEEMCYRCRFCVRRFEKPQVRAEIEVGVDEWANEGGQNNL